MELIEKQRKLEADLAKFDKQRDAATVKIKAARKAIDEFTKEHGNVIHKARRDAEWADKQAELAELRKTPEWQARHKEWLAKKKVEEDARLAIAPKTTGMKPGSFFFIHKDMKKKDRELFFGPLDGSEEFVVFDDTWIMAHVFVHVGLFPSLSQARKNGGEGPIKEGFSDFTRGKNQRRKEITILNKF